MADKFESKLKILLKNMASRARLNCAALHCSSWQKKPSLETVTGYVVAQKTGRNRPYRAKSRIPSNPKPDVAVRVRRSIVQIERQHASVRPIVPIATSNEAAERRPV